VKLLAGGKSPRLSFALVKKGTDLVEFQSRRLKSGWEKING
jgi:hypothetical protein